MKLGPALTKVTESSAGKYKVPLGVLNVTAPGSPGGRTSSIICMRCDQERSLAMSMPSIMGVSQTHKDWHWSRTILERWVGLNA